MPKQIEHWDASLPCGTERLFNSNAHRSQFLKLHRKKCEKCKQAKFEFYEHDIYVDKNDSRFNIKYKEQQEKVLDVLTKLAE